MANVSKFLLGVLTLVTTAHGAEVATQAKTPSGTSPNASVTGTVTAPTAGSIIGVVDFRPSYKSTAGSFANELWAQAGYRFADGNSVYYRQEFSTNVYNPSASSGLNALTLSGSFRAKVNNIWQNKESGLSLNWEPRLYVPTDGLKRDAGMITAVRNYVKIRKQLSSTAYLQLSDSPILHVYSSKGATVLGKIQANPFVENRVLLEAEVELFIKGLTLYMPIELQSVHFHSFGGAANNASWGHNLSFWPELTYPVAKTIRMGLAFRTDNMIKPDFSATTISDAFRLGVTQVILSAAL